MSLLSLYFLSSILISNLFKVMQKKKNAPKVDFNDELLKSTKTDASNRPNSSK